MGLVQEVTEATNAGERKIYTRVCVKVAARKRGGRQYTLAHLV